MIGLIFFVCAIAVSIYMVKNKPPGIVEYLGYFLLIGTLVMLGFIFLVTSSICA